MVRPIQLRPFLLVGFGVISRLLLYLLLAAAAVRMGLYLAYAAVWLPFPLETHVVEANMVLLAYRAQHGLSLYPPWWDYPYVTNIYGPVNSVLVGGLGWLFGTEIRGLFLIGRAVSFGSALSTTFLIAVWTGRSYGRGAALAAAVLSLGNEAMKGFTVMVRADALADLLGFAGFLLTGGPRAGTRIAGVALILLAILTKQTSGIFLLAAALALGLEGQRRWAYAVLGGGLAVLLLVVGLVNVLIEPYFAVSLLSVATMHPWDYHAWRVLFGRVALIGGDLLVLPVAGLVLWLGQRPRAVRPAALTIVLLSAAVGLSGKIGADMNYYLCLRIPEGFAAGALWKSVHAAAGRSAARMAGLTLTTALAIATMYPGILAATGLYERVREYTAFLATPGGQRTLAAYRSAIALARDPGVALLTDSGLLDLYQGERAAFGDPFQFHTLVDRGKLQPTTLIERLDAQHYDVVITTHNLDSPQYVNEDFRLPDVLIEHARAHYVFRSVEPGPRARQPLYYYGRRGEPWPPPRLLNRSR
jgi:hypothetical protein